MLPLQRTDKATAIISAWPEIPCRSPHREDPNDPDTPRISREVSSQWVSVVHPLKRAHRREQYVRGQAIRVDVWSQYNVDRAHGIEMSMPWSADFIEICTSIAWNIRLDSLDVDLRQLEMQRAVSYPLWR